MAGEVLHRSKVAGGIVPGRPGQEMLALLEAGERVTPAGSDGAAAPVHLDDATISKLSRAIVEAERAAGPPGIRVADISRGLHNARVSRS